MTTGGKVQWANGWMGEKASFLLWSRVAAGITFWPPTATNCHCHRTILLLHPSRGEGRREEGVNGYRFAGIEAPQEINPMDVHRKKAKKKKKWNSFEGGKKVVVVQEGIETSCRETSRCLPCCCCSCPELCLVVVVLFSEWTAIQLLLSATNHPPTYYYYIPPCENVANCECTHTHK